MGDLISKKEVIDALYEFRDEVIDNYIVSDQIPIGSVIILHCIEIIRNIPCADSEENMSEDKDKEVFFNIWCPTCKYSTSNEDDEPCCDCVGEGSNINSHKPTLWEEKS